jgi:hypothetical protein
MSSHLFGAGPLVRDGGLDISRLIVSPVGGFNQLCDDMIDEVFSFVAGYRPVLALVCRKWRDAQAGIPSYRGSGRRGAKVMRLSQLAGNGELGLLRWWHGCAAADFSPAAYDAGGIHAARTGHLAVVQWCVVRNGHFGAFRGIIAAAAEHGRMAVVEWAQDCARQATEFYESASVLLTAAALHSRYQQPSAMCCGDETLRWAWAGWWAARTPLAPDARPPAARALVELSPTAAVNGPVCRMSEAALSGWPSLMQVTLPAAARGGHVAALEWCRARARGAGQRTGDFSGFENGACLLEAAGAGRLAAVQYIMRHAAVLPTALLNGVLATAAGGGHLAIMALCAEKGAIDFDRALHAAVSAYQLRAADWAVARGAAVSAAMLAECLRGGEHLPCVKWAAARRGDKALDDLLQFEAECSPHPRFCKWYVTFLGRGQCPRTLQEAMRRAAVYGDLALVKWCARRGAGNFAEALEWAQGSPRFRCARSAPARVAAWLRRRVGRQAKNAHGPS